MISLNDSQNLIFWSQLVGMEECQNRIEAMVREAKEKVGLPVNLKLKALVWLECEVLIVFHF